MSIGKVILDLLPPSVIQGLADMNLRQQLTAYAAEPAAAKKAVRDMSAQEGFDVLMNLVYQGEVLLAEPIKTDSAGKLISPSPQHRVVIRTTMAGVDYFQAAEHTKTPRKSDNAHQTANFQPTPAFAIVLYRLAAFLRKQWGVTRIVWGGIGAGGDGKTGDCHRLGHCVDFYGALTSKGLIDVWFDWARRPVYKNGKAQPDGWGNTTQTSYRLRENLDEPAYSFFKDVYQFASEQCADGSGGVIGKTSFIIHPDYPDPGLRSSHEEHMHLQIGKTYG